MESPCDDYFIRFCETVFSYQYVARPSAITPEIIETLYQCSNGVIGLVISLLIESQQTAILSSKEELTKEVILSTFHTRMKNLQNFIDIGHPKAKQTSTLPKEKPVLEKTKTAETSIKGVTIKQLVQQSKDDNTDIVKLLKASDIQIMEIAI